MSRLSHLVAAPLLAVSHAASATTGAQLHAAQESKVGDCWEKTQEHVWCTDAAYGANGMFSGDLHEPRQFGLFDGHGHAGLLQLLRRRSLAPRGRRRRHCDGRRPNM